MDPSFEDLSHSFDGFVEWKDAMNNSHGSLSDSLRDF